MTESKKLKITINKNIPNPEFNLIQLVNPTLDKQLLNHQIKLIRTGFNNAINQIGFLNNSSIICEKSVTRILPYTASINELPFLIPVEDANSQNNEFNNNQKSYTWLSSSPKKLNDWNFVIDVYKEKNEQNQLNPVLNNWMEKREGDTTMYFRFFMNLYFQQSLSDLNSKYFQGIFEYSSRDKTQKLDEKVMINTTMNLREDGSLDIKEYKATFTVWPISFEEKKIVFCYKNNKVVNDSEKSKLNLIKNGTYDNFNSEIIKKMLGDSNSKFGIDSIVAAHMFPNFKIDSQKLDIDKTLEYILFLFRTGTPKDLSGFKHIYFK